LYERYYRLNNHIRIHIDKKINILALILSNGLVHAFSIGVNFTLLLVKLASTGTAKAAEVANELIPTAMAAVSNMAFIPFDLASEV
jgi:hypothetical protein